MIISQNMKRLKFFVCALLLLATAGLLQPAPAVAQGTSGQLVGTVSGPDGVIPGATVTAVDNQTGREKTAQTNDEGAFTLPQLEFGTYTVTIKAQGFKTFSATELKIDAGRDYSLNPTLEVGGVEETVTVIAGADVVNASNGTLSNTVSPAQITQLPLDGRNPLALITLQPGASSTGSNNGTTSINGQRTAFTNVTRDGINVNDNFIRGNATDFSPERPSSDDTGEFTVVTQNAGAELGYGAAQVILVTPRGQSEFHGGLWEYNRNSRFSANTYTNNASGRDAQGNEVTPRAFLNRNQFGGKVGGPMPLPRFGEGGSALIRNKAFFFFSYEKQFLRESQTNSPVVLTDPARSGIFRFIDSTGATRSVNIFSLPVSGGNSTSPAPTGINPIIQQRILAGMPLPNTPGGDLNTGVFSVNQAANSDYNYYTGRLDFDINQQNSIHGVYTYKKQITLRPDFTLDSFSNTPPVTQPGINKFLSTAWIYTPSGRFTNEARGGFSFPVANFVRVDPVPPFFIRTPTLNDTLRNNGGVDFVNSPETASVDQGRTQHNYNLQNNATLIAGDHSFRFGGVAQFFRVEPFNFAGTVPTYTLGQSTNAPVLTAASFASVLPAGATISATDVSLANNLYHLLGGVIGLGQQTFNPVSREGGFGPAPTIQDYAWENYGFYFADQWRVGPQLTLNLGLRYEITTGLAQRNGLALEPIIPSGVDPRTALTDPNGGYQFVGGNAGGKNRYYKTDKDNFAPVVSFAYSPEFKNRLFGALLPGGGRTVIRGGYRMSYAFDQTLTAARNAITQNVGLGATQLNAVVNGSAQLNVRPENIPGIAPPPPLQLPRTFAQNNTAQFGNFGTVYGVDPDLQSARIHEYSFGIQREVGFQTAIEIRYVGSRSNNLVRAADFNQVQIFNNGFLADFLRASANRTNTGNAFCNPATTANCQALTIFGTGPTARIRVATGTANAVSLATFNNNLAAGTPGQLAFNILGVNADFNAANGQFPLTANPNAGVANLVYNGAEYNYNSLQAEVRRRFAQGLYFQANYTFSKNLTNSVGTSQALLDPFLDNGQPDLEYARAEFDQTHAFNLNTIYELPFGRGKRFFGESTLADAVLGGWQLTTILHWGTGSPITFTDARGTVNRTGRSTRQTPNSPLTKDQLKSVVGDFTRDGVRYFINPDYLIITRNADGTVTSKPAPSLFTQALPGQVGNVERTVVNGPSVFSMDAGLSKRFQFGERYSLQLRGEAFNLTNRNNFFLGTLGASPTIPLISINSNSFGQLSPAFSQQAQGLQEPRRLQFAIRFEF